ncbi:MAG TPA: energy transducer TonB [Terriglobales bacterium]|nr:energy transducer TonB [Terriglobales bacterium]
MAQPAPQFLEIPFDGWITAYHPQLVDAQGNRLPSRMLHHVAFWNTGRSDFLCPNKEEHIFGAGGEMNDWPALPGVGYRVLKGDRIRITSMFHNPTETSYPEVYLQVVMEYVQKKDRELKSVYPAWFDAGECGNSGYDLPAGASTKTGEFRLNYTGTLLGVGGHLHDDGRRLVLENTSRKETVATLGAKLNAEGHILEMPIAKFEQGYALNKGEVLKVTASYENPGPASPQGAMGIVVGYFVPKDDVEMTELYRIYQVGHGVKAPVPIRTRGSEFSSDSRAKKPDFTGTVILRAIIGSNGQVREARVIRSAGKSLDQKAVEAVRQWKFEPARKNGEPVTVLVQIEVNFRLYDDGSVQLQPPQ